MTVIEIFVDITRAERYLFASEGILHFQPFIRHEGRLQALFFRIYVLLKQNWLQRYSVFRLCLFDPVVQNSWILRKYHCRWEFTSSVQRGTYHKFTFFHQSLSASLSLPLKFLWQYLWGSYTSKSHKNCSHKTFVWLKQ